MEHAIAYVDGQYLNCDDAKISIYDRGYLMADAVYEVCAVVGGKLIDNDAHLKRLMRSLNELNIPLPVSLADIVNIQKKLIEDNKLNHAEIYLQISRGVGMRDFLISPTMRPTLVMFPLFHNPVQAQKTVGIRVQTMEDIRWLRRDIKTTQLLAQSLAKTQAVANGFDDAWFIDNNGMITEGTANNVYIIKDGCIYTRPANHEILNGITRRTMMRIMENLGITWLEQAFSLTQALQADEAFITSAACWAIPVININGQIIGNGKAGEITLTLRDGYLAELEKMST